MGADTSANTMLQTASPERPRGIKPSTKLRNLELMLTLLALVISAGGISLVQLGANGKLDPHLLGLGAGLAVLVLGLHVVIRLTARDADPFVVPIATALTGIGIAEIYRIDISPKGVANHWDDGTHQIWWTAVAVVAAALLIVFLRNHRVLQRFTYISMFAAILLLLLPLVPFFRPSDVTALVWVRLGPVQFQPGEFAKLLLAVFFAGYLVARRDSLAMVGRKVLGIRFPRLRDLGPILVIWALAMIVIVLEHDLGTGLLLFGMFVAMLYVATGRTSWVVIGLVLAVAGAWAASQTLSYVDGRFTNWLQAFSPKVYEAVGGSYQLVQGLFGLGAGGMVGTGLGQGMPYLVPEASSDFIIASLGEELGLVGLFAIFAMYLLFVSRGFRVGFAGPDDFGKLLCAGLAFAFALQCFIVIGGVFRVIPATGLTTPFLAAGGSSLIANWIIAALLLRVSDTIRSQPRTVI